MGVTSNRDAIEARVTVRSGGTTQVNHVSVRFGLGHSSRADSIEIEWPSGFRQMLTNVPAGSFLTVRERRAP